MRTAVARAPGKLFITGEYAVLAGAPALVAAVDRYAEVRVAVHDDGGGVEVDSLADGVCCAVDDADAGELPGGDAGAVLAALRAARARVPRLGTTRIAVAVDSRPFLHGALKLGLGRSAATLVAAVAALLAAFGVGDRAAALAVAVAAHGAFQGGHGSGADVAAAVHGGVVEVLRHDGGIDVTPRRLPAGLTLVAGFTGESAATTPLLRRFAQATAGAQPRALAALREVAAQAAAAVADGDAAALRDAVRRSAGLLDALGRETGLPIVTPALARLVAAAERAGAVAKPSGAGGGDCGLALADSPAQAAAVAAAWRAAGITPLALGIAAQGVAVG